MASTLFSFRAEKGTRTLDLLITNELLYQLSYFGKQLFKSVAKIEQSFELYLFNCVFFFFYIAFLIRFFYLRRSNE